MDGLELIMCAEINFNNVTKMNPALGSHPFFKMAMEQLKEGIKLLEQEEESGQVRD